jgi:hypothetical protein
MTEDSIIITEGARIQQEEINQDKLICLTPKQTKLSHYLWIVDGTDCKEVPRVKVSNSHIYDHFKAGSISFPYPNSIIRPKDVKITMLELNQVIDFILKNEKLILRYWNSTVTKAYFLNKFENISLQSPGNNIESTQHL